MTTLVPGKTTKVSLLGPVLPRPARVVRPAVKLAEDDPVALEDQLLHRVARHRLLRRRTARKVGAQR
jgi:hypothetical protein